MRIFGIAILCFLVFELNAASYTFTRFTETYQELSDPDFVIPDTSQYWNGGQILLKQPMTIKAFGTVFDLNDGIYMVMQQGYFYMYSKDGNYSVTFDNFAADLQPRKGPTVSEFSYKLDGGPGSKILKLQFKNFGFLNGPETDYVNYQVWLHERGLIDVRFGTNYIQAASYDGKPGPAIGLFHMDDQFSTMYEEFYITGDPSGPTTYHQAVYLNGTPTDGTVYRFEPEHFANLLEPRISNIFSAYPCPANDKLHIRIPENTTGEISLSDLTGKVITRQAIDANKKEDVLDISALSAGVYVLTLRSGKEVRAIRVLKE